MHCAELPLYTGITLKNGVKKHLSLTQEFKTADDGWRDAYVNPACVGDLEEGRADGFGPAGLC